MHTFVVRLWVPADGIRVDADVRGVVRDVATGAENPFRSGEELLALLRQDVTSTPASLVAAGDDPQGSR